MLPLLKVIGDGKEHMIKASLEDLSKIFNLTEQEKNMLYETKRVRVFYDRLQWSVTYLKSAGLLSRTKREFIKVTDRGLDVLKSNPSNINNKFLRQFPEFLEFIKAVNHKVSSIF